MHREDPADVDEVPDVIHLEPASLGERRRHARVVIGIGVGGVGEEQRGHGTRDDGDREQQDRDRHLAPQDSRHPTAARGVRMGHPRGPERSSGVGWGEVGRRTLGLS